MHDCNSCGLEVTDGKAFCGHCGAPQLQASESSERQPGGQIKGGKIALIIGSIVAGLTLGAIFVGVVFSTPWQNMAQVPAVSPYPSWIPSGIPTAMPTQIAGLEIGNAGPETSISPEDVGTDAVVGLLPTECPLDQYLNLDIGSDLEVETVKSRNRILCWFSVPNSGIGWFVEYKKVTWTQWEDDLELRLAEGFGTFERSDGIRGYSQRLYSEVDGGYYNVYFINHAGIEVVTDVFEGGLMTALDAIQVR